MTANDTLIVFLRGHKAAHITRRGPQLSLVYSDEYAEQPTASPLSLSMPLRVAQVDDRRVIAADNPQTWAATASAVGLDPDEGINRAQRIADAVPQALERATDELQPEFRDSPTLQTLLTMSIKRRDQCLKGRL